MDDDLTLALAQMAIDPDVGRNWATIERLLGEAASRGAELVAFPELCLTAHGGRPRDAVAESVPGPTSDRFAALSRRHRLAIVGGSVIERDAGGGLFNTAIVVDQGRLIGAYRKRNRWCSELGSLRPGAAPGLVATRWGPIGVMVCWDLAFPACARDLAATGARLVVCCAHWQAEDRYGPHRREDAIGRLVPDDERIEERFVDACCAARACENGVAFAFVNACGATPIGSARNRCIGRSQVHQPFHGAVAAADGDEELLVVRLDLRLAALADAVYGLRGGWDRAASAQPAPRPT